MALPHKVVLLQHQESRTCDPSEPDARTISLRDGTVYHVRSTPRLARHPQLSIRSSLSSVFQKFPIIILGNRIPWYEANIWISEQIIEGGRKPFNMGTIVDDLVAYARFLERDADSPVDWTDFSSPYEFQRPTYKFAAYLNDLVETRELAHSSAKRRIQTVIRFYRWLIEEKKVLIPKHAPWKDTVISVTVSSRTGDTLSVLKTKTNLKINGHPYPDPTDDRISDGGKLRPLSIDEQALIQKALSDLDNYELHLMHWIALETGARTQSILTLRKKQFWKSVEKGSHFGTAIIKYCPELPSGFISIAIGPGSGADTKKSKRHNLFVPVWLYVRLHTYVHSDRASRRRIAAVGGDIDDQFLFLTKYCNPWYESDQIRLPSKDNPDKRRSERRAGSLRTLLADEIMPRVSEEVGFRYKYQFHDLRATFGVNEINRLLGQPKSSANPNGPKWTLAEVLLWISKRLNHTHLSTTEDYLRVRENLNLTRAAQDLWESEIFDKQIQAK